MDTIEASVERMFFFVLNVAQIGLWCCKICPHVDFVCFESALENISELL